MTALGVHTPKKRRLSSGACVYTRVSMDASARGHRTYTSMKLRNSGEAALENELPIAAHCWGGSSSGNNTERNYAHLHHTARTATSCKR